jgi:hypothetical protein
MNPLVKPYISKLLALTLIIEILVSLLYFITPQIFSYYFLALPFYFFAIMAFFHVLLVTTTEKKAQLFVNRFMLLTGIKLLLNLVIILILAFVLKGIVVPIVICFLILYIIFTIFEVRELLKIISKASND